jgi:ElaB/YqjD/DUF883 family membrane-anchored ribosome-binding protein
MSASIHREAAFEAKEAVHDIGKAASAATADFGADIESLRNDLAKLAAQVSEIVAERGNAAWRKAKANAGEAAASARDRSVEAVEALRDEALRKRPYATLAVAVGVGFILGMTLRR